MKEQLLTSEEVNDILFDVNTMNVSEMVREIYQKGYEQAVADMQHVEQNGVVMP